MRSEAPATAAIISTRFGHGPRCNTEGSRFGRDVEHSNHLPVLQTFVRSGLADSHEEITSRLSSFRGRIVIVLHSGGGRSSGTQFLFRELGDLHAQNRE